MWFSCVLLLQFNLSCPTTVTRDLYVVLSKGFLLMIEVCEHQFICFLDSNCLKNNSSLISWASSLRADSARGGRVSGVAKETNVGVEIIWERTGVCEDSTGRPFMVHNLVVRTLPFTLLSHRWICLLNWKYSNLL